MRSPLPVYFHFADLVKGVCTQIEKLFERRVLIQEDDNGALRIARLQNIDFQKNGNPFRSQIKMIIHVTLGNEGAETTTEMHTT